eukprot:10309187-Lingulodinium_polyedra.AAC.1
MSRAKRPSLVPILAPSGLRPRPCILDVLDCASVHAWIAPVSMPGLRQHPRQRYMLHGRWCSP